MGAKATRGIYNRPTGKIVLANDLLNLVNGVSEIIPFDFVMPNFIDGIEDVGNNWIKPNRPGFYLVIGQATFTAVVANQRYRIQLLHREDVAVSVPFAQDNKHSSNTSDLCLRVVEILWMGLDNTVDAIELWATSFSGGNTVDIIGDALSTFLIAQRLR